MPMTKREAVHAYICTHPGCGNAEIAEALELTQDQVGHATLALSNAGEVLREGTRLKAAWTALNAPPSVSTSRREAEVACRDLGAALGLGYA